MFEKFSLWLRGLPGGACELNVEDPGGYGFQLNAQRLEAVVWEFLQDRVGSAPVRPNWFQFRSDRAVVAEILRLYRYHGGRGLVAIVAEEDTHGHDGEALQLVEALQAEIGQENVLLADPAWIEPDKDKNILGQEVAVAFRDVTVPTLVREYLDHGVPLEGFLALAREGRVINPLGLTPAGTRSAMVVLSRERSRLPRLVRQLSLGAWPLEPLAGDVARNPDGYVLKHEGTYSGKGILIGGLHDAEIQEVLASGAFEGWVVERKLDPSLWSDEFTFLEAGQLQRRLETLDLRVFVTDKGCPGFLCRFNERPPTNVGSGGGVQGFVVVPDRRAARALREWYRQALEKLGPAELEELEVRLVSLARELGHWYLLGPIRGTLEPRILTRAGFGISESMRVSSGRPASGFARTGASSGLSSTRVWPASLSFSRSLANQLCWLLTFWSRPGQAGFINSGHQRGPDPGFLILLQSRVRAQI